MGFEKYKHPKKSEKVKFFGLEIVIHTDVGHKILRPMVKELALYNLRFLSYGQKTAFSAIFLKKWPKSQFFGYNSKTVSHRELIPSP